MLERILSKVRLNFRAGAIIVFLLIGPLGSFLYLYFVSFDAGYALYGTFGLEAGVPANFYSVASNSLWYGFLLFVPFSIRHLRMKLGKVEPTLASLSPDGETTIRSLFSPASSATFQLAIAAVFMTIYASSVPQLLSSGEFTTLSGSVYLLRSILRSLVFGSVLGLYCGALWGLYRLGKRDLRLKPFKQDRYLGLREVGSLSFTFASVYFGGLGIFTIHAVLGGMTGELSIVNLLFMMSLPLLGVMLFFAPLVSTHQRMVEAKEGETATLVELSGRILSRVPKGGEDDTVRYTELLALEALERKASAIPTWPFGTQMLGKLTTIMLSVTAIVIARIIQIAFGL